MATALLLSRTVQHCAVPITTLAWHGWLAGWGLAADPSVVPGLPHATFSWPRAVRHTRITLTATEAVVPCLSVAGSMLTHEANLSHASHAVITHSDLAKHESQGQKQGHTAPPQGRYSGIRVMSAALLFLSVHPPLSLSVT